MPAVVTHAALRRLRQAGLCVCSMVEAWHTSCKSLDSTVNQQLKKKKWKGSDGQSKIPFQSLTNDVTQTNHFHFCGPQTGRSYHLLLFGIKSQVLLPEWWALSRWQLSVNWVYRCVCWWDCSSERPTVWIWSVLSGSMWWRLDPQYFGTWGLVACLWPHSTPFLPLSCYEMSSLAPLCALITKLNLSPGSKASRPNTVSWRKPW